MIEFLWTLNNTFSNFLVLTVFMRKKNILKHQFFYISYDLFKQILKSRNWHILSTERKFFCPCLFFYPILISFVAFGGAIQGHPNLKQFDGHFFTTEIVLLKSTLHTKWSEKFTWFPLFFTTIAEKKVINSYIWISWIWLAI